uniref:Uncharacterized protein n=1 Tax=Chromera velia CCMP2878 TaxID=1169474 RepID=A0A0G4FMK4_9ALVE|eukprot:Cvel_17619.t1-p1 / transcript=Cvel_17619.t1 / gene=Cvel_17619 / organism=Chromera_velia_CCMP2878 / gene_product=hypothetical protein / transcript_product=hypothetical protein / location=Cvel_scaffold1418:206-1450(+) / protein_length=415 / sequence_SO=supercontig / SO=protein_coding / is_pseudo=false
MRPVEPVKTGGVSAVPPAHSGASRLDMSKSGGMHRFPMGASNSSSFSSKEQQQQHQKTQPRFHPGPLPALPAGSAEKGGKGQRREEYTQPTMRMSALGMEDEDVVMDGDSSPPSCSSAAANVEMAEDTGTGPGKGNSATADPRGNVGQMAAQQQQQQQQRFFNPHTQTQAQKETVLRPLCEPNRAPPNKPGAPASSSFKFPFPPQQNTQRSNQKTPATNTSFNSSQGHQKDHREAASSAVAPAGLSRGGRGIDRGRDNFSREFPAPTSTSFSAHPLPSSSNVAPGAALGGGVACSGSGNGMERRKPGTAVPLVVNTGGKRKSSAPSPSAKNGSKRGGEGGAPAPRKQVKLQQQQSQQQQQQTATGAQRGKRKAAAAGQNPPSASTSAAPLQKQKAQTTIFSHFPVKPKAPSQPTQ